MKITDKKNFIINVAYFFVWIAILYFAFKVASVYLLPFLIGIIIAFYVQKPAVFISNKLGANKANCAAVLSVLIFLIVIAVFVLLGWFFYVYISKFINHLFILEGSIKETIKKIYIDFENIIEGQKLKNILEKVTDETIVDFVAKITSYFSGLISRIIKNIPSLLLSSIITVVATCYISKDYDKLIKFLSGFLNKGFLLKISIFKNIFSECVFKMLLGYFCILIITFLELTFCFALIGVKNFVSIAILVAILDALPIVGTGTVLLPWACFSFVGNNYKLGIALVCIYIVVSIVRNFIEPKIIGKQTGINPIFSLFFIFIGFRLYGLLGMLILPLVLTVLYTYYARDFSRVKAP